MPGMVAGGHLEQCGVVVIGRDEGERLVRCLASTRSIRNRVYVDSGSTDGSVEHAAREGVAVIELEVPPKFTAARARNTGVASLLSQWPDLSYVQFVDGDCEIHPAWIPAALAALHANPNLAAVFGRLRERFPQRSIYNALCDEDWNVPVGEAAIVGGIALFRVAALSQVGFFDPTMIAGEEPDLSMRMRKNGWRLSRIDAEMALHDANITRFTQWWQRTRRTGHAFAELAYRHPDARDPNWRHITSSNVFWGGVMPLVLLGAVILALLFGRLWWLVGGLVLLIWAMRVLQMTWRDMRAGLSLRLACASGVLLMVGKIPQLLGVAEYHWHRLTGRASRLIEYKGSTRTLG
jgi:GT2 family glycosyltransferase